MAEILIKKQNGELEVFDSEKLRQSLLRSHASIIAADSIVKKVEEKIKKRTTTNEIYKEAFKLLKQSERASALRYSIRRSIIELGPSGFPFEKFIEKVFQKRGYRTKVGVILQGNCVEHEIDVVALSPKNELFLTEVKFHNELYLKSDTKVALYIKARFDDLKNMQFDLFDKKLKPKRMLLVTNTKFTENAIKYAECAGVDLISWDYPEKGNLHSLVYESDTYPITILESLSKNDKNFLISKGIITCDDLLSSKQISSFNSVKISKINSEVESINAK
jgi:hypothetical protein